MLSRNRSWLSSRCNNRAHRLANRLLLSNRLWSVHTRNNNYWREGANLDAIEITAITDPVARVNALLAGDMQMITAIDPKAFRQVESSSNAKLLSTPAALPRGGKFLS